MKQSAGMLDNKSLGTVKSLLETLNFDYFKLLDLLTIARSRKHIEKYYDVTEIGKFSERLRPVNIKADIDREGRFPALKDINREIRLLNLSAYAPLKYILPHKAEEYSRKYDRKLAGGSVFRQVDREQSLIHLMRANLFKRMESSIHSFTMTLTKLLGEVDGLIQKIADHGNTTAVEEFDIEGDISITDLTLNDFRMDLCDYIKEHGSWLTQIPPGAFAVVSIEDSLKDELSPGVVFCLKNEGSQTVSDTTH